jgi:ribosomal protein S18 acetylase RimI-like enzyme
MADLRYRRATRSDADATLALIESAFRGEASRAGWTTEAELLEGQRTDLEEVVALIDGPATRILLAEREGALVGCVLLRQERERGCAYLGMLSVRPALQIAGIGSALVTEAERVTRDDLGLGTLRMRVISQRASLIAWYERRGYRATGEREPFPYGDPRSGIPLRDDLEFVVLAKDVSR